jgi:predicted Zn-dependent protease
LSAQTKITAPKNKFSPQQDVEEGMKAAAEVEKQLPILRDDAVTSYVQDVGARLVGAIPLDFNYSEFHYTFKVVDVKDINAFALPGGPMYVHRGIIEAAQTEGELAGVMAHEMSHVALRHGTAQATKATTFGLGQLAGAVAGAVIGGGVGAVVTQASSFGLSTAFLRFSREYEKQADILGVQMMAQSGYDPRDLGHMFETIEKEGGGRPPQWLSDHPNPGNRVGYINEEAFHLTIENPVGASRAFADIQAHLKTLPPAPTMEEIAKKQKANQPRR